MKKIILLTVLLFATIQFSVAQNTIAKLKFEEAEEAYTNNDFELCLTKLKEVETMLKSTNPRILYLQILAQDKIISKNIWADYTMIENIRSSFNKYLIDYENLPDNEDKYREMYKISENYKEAPTSLQEFNELIKEKELKTAAKKEEENDKIKKGEEYFMKFEYITTFQLGLTLEETIIRYPEFKRHYKYEGNGVFWDYSIASKETKGDIMGLHIKNKKVIGYYGEYRYGDDLNFGRGEKFINDIFNENNKKFYFSPAIENYDLSGNKLSVLPENKAGTSTTYSWVKNNKTVSFSHFRQPTNIGTGYTTISFSVIDQNLATNYDRWGESQNNTSSLLKSDNTNSTNNTINLLKSGNPNSANNTLNLLKSENKNSATNTTTSITVTSTLDEKAEYKKAKIDYKEGTISKDAYKEAIKKYGAYAAFESKRLQKAYQNKEITYSEYNEALKILLRK